MTRVHSTGPALACGRNRSFRASSVDWTRIALTGALCALALLGGCRSGTFPTSGPSRAAIAERAGPHAGVPAQIALIDVDGEVAQRLSRVNGPSRFSTALGGERDVSYTVGRGDLLDVTIWETPPAMLFGSAGSASAAGAALSAGMVSAPNAATTLPTQMVSSDSTIVVPYAGDVVAAGKSTHDIEADIVRRLKGKANQPQVMVRVANNASAQVTVVGEVRNSTRMPLTPRGERLLDALAAAGGPVQPVGKITVQLTRNGASYAMPLADVIRDPAQNVPLRAADVMTVLYQPLSFTALGATGKNEEVSFEASGITLAQALARVGGLQDSRADPTGVFIFRFEDPSLFGAGAAALARTPDGKLPVVYRIDLKDAASFFAAQRFPMRDKDVMYVANAPAAELQKFLNIVLAGAYPILNVFTLTR